MIPLPAAPSMPRPATVVLAVIVAATALGAPLAVAQTGSPGEPIAFHGAAVDGDGDAAPVGTAIVAAVDGAEVDRVTVAAAGVYAGDGPTDAKLRTTTAAGASVTFHVGGVGGPTAAQTHDVEGPGVFELDLVFPAGTFAAEESGGGGGSGGGSGGGGGGAGSGGGGGGSTPATESPGEDVAAAATFDADGRASATVEGLAGGDTASIDLGDGIGDADASITRVDVTVGDGDDGRSITFEGASLPGPPSEGAAFRTGDAGDDALSYFELSVTAGDGAEPVESATVTFTVDAAGLDERGLDPGDVALHRYDEETGSWGELTTELVGEADGELVYEATTPGFSLFAVGPSARQTTPDGGTATPDPGTPDASQDDGAEAPEEDATPDADATHGPDTEAEAADDGQRLLSRVVPAVLLVAGVVVVVLGLLFVRRR